MATRYIKIIAVTIMLLSGTVLMVYGSVFHIIPVLPQKEDTNAVARSESSVIKEVTVGGVRRDGSGKIKQTYTGQAPKACPT